MSNVAKLPAKGESLTPMQMLNQAIQQGSNVEIMEKLLGLQERWERNEARKAFDAAMAEATSELPVIVKEREMSFGNGRQGYKFEDLAGIIRAVSPILHKHGLGYRFRTDTKDGIITVTCVLFHRDGHAEENSLSAGADMSGSKNAIQGIGSAQTYLQRYTLKAALGLAASADDDASGGADMVPGKTPQQQINQITALAMEVGADVTKFCRYMKVASIDAIPPSRVTEAIAALESKRARK